jgi:hypothetical protein
MSKLRQNRKSLVPGSGACCCGERRQGRVRRPESTIVNGDIYNMKCKVCESPQPHLHPAVQHEGEVQLCRDDFHRTVTPQNSPAMIAEVQKLIAATAVTTNEDRR